MSPGAMSVTTTYPEFVSFVQKFLIEYNNAERSRTTDMKNDSKGGVEVPILDKGEFVEYKLVCGHLFDRLITEYAISEAAKNSESDSNSGSEKHSYDDITGSENTRDVRVKEGEISVVDRRISVVYMLVALNMAVRSNVNATAEERVESLFKIAQIITNMKETTHHMITGEGDTVSIQNEVITSSLNQVKTDVQGSGSIIQTDGDDNKNKDADTEGHITVDSAQQVVDHLIHSWQVCHHGQSVYVSVFKCSWHDKE